VIDFKPVVILSQMRKTCQQSLPFYLRVHGSSSSMVLVGLGKPVLRVNIAFPVAGGLPSRHVQRLPHRHATAKTAQHATGAWWKRELIREYLPTVSLNE
jgi:hypothetical protein